MMKVLVTGATGFIGKNLCNQLVQDKTNVVFALIRPTSVIQGLSSDVHLLVYNNQIEQLVETLDKIKIEGIVHLASLFLASHKYSDIDNLVDANLRLGMYLLEAAVLTNVQWFINTSSFWQHYRGQKYNPVALYAATKQAFETILLYYREISNLRMVTLELFDTYGPNDRRSKLFNLLKNTLDSEKPLLMSPGRQRLNLVYIEDVVAAYIQLMGWFNDPSKELREKYCVSAQKLVSLREVVKLFSDVVGQDLNILWGGRPYRERELMNPKSLYPGVPGWKPRYTLEAGIRKMCYLDGVILSHE